jgi:hypothetical protein
VSVGISLNVHVFWCSSLFPSVGETKKMVRSIPAKNRYAVNLMRPPRDTLEPRSYDITIRMGLFVNTRLEGIDL